MSPNDRFVAATRRAMIIPGMLWPREMHALSQLFAVSEHHAEVGVFCGKSLYVTAAAMHIYGCASPSKRIVVVDNFSERLNNQFEIVPSSSWWRAVLDATIGTIRREFAIEVTLLDCSSVDAARKCAGGDSFDSVYIDANHAQEYVAQDIRSWWSLLRPGGTLAGHDYSAECLGTMNAVNNAFGSLFQVLPDTRIWLSERNSDTDASIERFCAIT